MSHIDRRRELRNFSRDDPLNKQEEAPPPEDGSVQVGDGLVSDAPADSTYQKDRFANPIKVATLIAESEVIQPNLDVGADKILFHRRQLRALSCLPASSPSTTSNGTAVGSQGSD